MNFGQAIEILKHGGAVQRAGWNGKGMFAYLVPANAYPAQTGVAKAFFGEGALVPYNAYLALKGVDGSVSTWAPSGSDALAEDWGPTKDSAVVSVIEPQPPVRNSDVAPSCEQFSVATIIANASGLPPHQQRVVEEKVELDSKGAKLNSFFETPIFAGLDVAEQIRLGEQLVAMQTYSDILGERIAAF